MNSMADEVANYIAGQGSLGPLGGSEDWNVNYGAEPATPVSVITVYDTGGQGPDTDELDIERPTFQVRVRGSVYRDAYAKQREIRDLLIFDAPIDMATCKVIGIEMTSDVLFIGRDDQKNFLLVANYLAIRNAKE